MAYTTINKPNTNFDVKLWTGNGSTQTISGLSFQPDLVWGKSRSTNYEQSWIDSVRGGTKYLFSNGTSAESTDANAITAFNSDGYDLGSSPYIGNANAVTYVGWNWLGGGTAVSNTDGSITSSVSANTTAGFSVVTYTGNGTSGSTIGHGLTSVPSMIIVKRRNATNGWAVYHKTLGTGSEVYLNLTQAVTSSNFWITTPTTSVFSVSSSDYVNTSSDTYVAYCFAEKAGFSKFGSYTGNNSTDGTFIYTGFKPAFVLIKKSSGSASWMMYDNARDPDNLAGNYLYANENVAAQTASQGMDFLSNGIKMRNTFGDANESGQTYIYMAFAENPLVGTNNVPATAR
jgi:hypothetical protein